LHCAAVYGKLAVVKLLLDRGANIEVPANDGKTVLHWAIDYGDEDVVELLLDRGSNIEATDKVTTSADIVT
jgi:ankyrin repeat protein